MPKATTVKPAATAPAEPEFIANIDTANEEVVRLTGELATAITRAETAEGLVAAANDATAAANANLAKMVKPEDHKAVVDAKAAVDAELVKANAKIAELGTKADTAATNATAAIAAAAITAPAQVKGADALTDDKSKITGKTGLARAIAANVALQAKA
jgi:hypothetical protein